MRPTLDHKATRSVLVSAFTFLAICSFAAVGSAAEARFALLIGNGEYQHAPDLRNAVNDATDLEQTLKQLGFQVTTVTNGDRRAMEESIDRFVSSLSPGSVGLFHFSGHGMQIDQENYLIPVDFELKDEASVKYDAYSASQLHDRMARSGSRLNIVILDACRNNGFTTSRSGSTGLAAMHAARGSFIAFATAPGATASDNPAGRNGLFTGYFIEALRKPGLKLDEVFNQVRESVYQASGNKQLAWTSSSVIGDFYFLPSGATPPSDRRDLVVVPGGQSAVVPVADPPRQAVGGASTSSSRDALEDRFSKIVGRAAAVGTSLDILRQEQARQGVSLRGDMAAAEAQLNLLLNQAEKALNDGNSRRAERSMDQLEPVLEKLERFLGM